MTEPKVTIELEDGRRAFRPGETLTVSYRVDSLSLADPKAVEASVLWHTEGQGDEDMVVHFFERHEADDANPVDFRQTRTLSTELPNSPLSYDGVIVKIHWLVRVRVFLVRGRDFVAEQPFRLGAVPAPVMAEST